MLSKLKNIFIIVLFLIITTSCSMFNQPEYLSDRSVQYEETTDELVLLFGFKNHLKQYISADTSFDVKIINDNNETVYQKIVDINKSNFADWTSKADDTRYLGSIRIKMNDIDKGTTSSGNLYFTVYKNGQLYFDESTISMYKKLPIIDPTVTCNDLPVKLFYNSYFSNEEILIDSITYEFDSFTESYMDIYVSGEKIKGNDYGTYKYKILDESGYVINNGTLFINDLNPGDKFKEKITIFDIEPAKNYTIEFSNDNY